MWKFKSSIPIEAIPYDLPKNWNWYYWEDLILTYEQGLIRSISQLGSGNVFYLKMGDLDNNGGCTLSNLAKTQASDDEIRAYSLNKGDFLINVRNSMELVGKTCVVGNTDGHLTLFNHMLVRIRHHEEVPGSFINAFFNIPSSRKLLDRCKQGTTTVIALYKRDLLKIPIPLPDKNTLNKIAAFYEVIDAKIDLNHRINAELEGLAKLLYDYWFVQFEFPLTAAQAAALGNPKLTGHPYQSSGGPMVHDPQLKRKIPKGWKVGPIADLCHLNQRTWGTANAPASVTYVDLANVKNGKILDFQEYEWATAPSRARRILTHGDTIIGTVRPGNRSFAMVPRSAEILTGSTGFAVLTPRAEIYREFNYLALTSDVNIDRLTVVASGAAYPAVNPEVVAAHIIAKPDEDSISQFHSAVRSAFDLIESHQLQTQELTALRDWLLPLLMNGQVRVG